jgi:hypothetical protein
MLSQFSPKEPPLRRPRPLWQLLLAAQTGQLSSLTPEECQALLEFLGDVVPEGRDRDQLVRQIGRHLKQAQKCR